MLENKKKEHPQILFYFIGIFPVIDFVNGLFLSEGFNLPIGILYRIVLFIVLFLLFINDYELVTSNFGILLILIIASYSLILAAQTIYFDNSLSILFNDTSAVVKYLLWFLIALLFSRIADRKMNHLYIGIDILFVIGLLVPYFLGLGNYTYTNSSAGYKSYFYATNDLTYIMVILCTFLLSIIIKCFSKKEWVYVSLLFSLYLLNCYCLLLIGTKIGIVYGIANLIVTIFYLLLFKTDVPYQIKFLILQLTFIGSIFVIFWGNTLFMKSIQGTVDRITYFYELYDGNWIKILSSSRSIYFTDALTNFIMYPKNQWVFLLGFGVKNRWSFFGRAGGYIEVDFLDTFFSYGAVGFIFFCLPLIYLIYRIFKYHLFTREAFLLFFTLGYAATAGHVFYSAASATILGLVVSRLLPIRKEEDFEYFNDRAQYEG
ncbi:hypothetical protein D920_00114 [Enterococcus faecalis 13-SD-W-01]|nr:hypothetical protein D920_00114 [Enterococcus faecalis 13-SD-W-01]